MTNGMLLLLSSYHGLNDSFNEEATKSSSITRRLAASQICNEYDLDLSMMEPTPIGSKIDIVKSVDIPQDPDIQKLCRTLEHVADILSDSCGSKRQREYLCHEDTVSVKKQKMYCTMQVPFPCEKTRQTGLKAPPSLLPPRSQFSPDLEKRPLTLSMIGNESFLDKKTPFHEFRSYQVDHWETQYEAMVRFRNQHNHCFVPYQYPENPTLASWVKRQRYQYKVMKAGRHHRLTPERRSKLEAIGFIWDSHKAIWEERYTALCHYVEAHGHTDVPLKFSDKSLGIWVKCQRRQHRLFRQGKPSSMTHERIIHLERIGFDWNPPVGCPCKQPTNGI